MNAVMLSIRPEWCNEILSRKKTLEIRKTRPRLATPFKAYIYCSQPKEARFRFWKAVSHFYCDDRSHNAPDRMVNGGVIAEFVCNKIEAFDVPYPAFQSEMRQDILERSCISYYPMHRYAYHDNLFAWDISNLKVYDSPKPVSDFFVEANATTDYPPLKAMTRPPQSWCYVEAVKGEEVKHE